MHFKHLWFLIFCIAACGTTVAQTSAWSIYGALGFSGRMTIVENDIEICKTCLTNIDRANVEYPFRFLAIPTFSLGAAYTIADRHVLILDFTRRGYQLEVYQDLDFALAGHFNGPNTPNWNVLKYQLNYLQLGYMYRVLLKPISVGVGASLSVLNFGAGEISWLYASRYWMGWEYGKLHNFGFSEERKQKIDRFDYGFLINVASNMNRIAPFITFYLGINDISKQLVQTGVHANLWSIHFGCSYTFIKQKGK